METAKPKKHRERSIFRHVLLPMGILLFLEIALLVGSIFGSGLFNYVDQNARDILQERVINRKNYLETEMIDVWSKVESTTYAINDIVQNHLDQGLISLDTLDSSSNAAAPLFLEITDDLIEMMRRNRVTGAFVVLNTDDMSAALETGVYEDKPALYFRDLDPTSPFNSSNQDLLIEKAPVAVVSELNIPTDSPWSPMFEFASFGLDSYPCFYEPYIKAYDATGDYNPFNFAYWSDPYCLPNDDKLCISYSVPLVLDDGTVYGVLGVEITLNYLNRLLPYEEITEERRGSYVLAVDKDQDLTFDNITATGSAYYYATSRQGKTVVENVDGSSNDYSVSTINPINNLYCHIEYLNLYNTNTPFSNQRWAVVSLVREYDLFAFSRHLDNILLTSIIVTLIAGLLGTFLISMFISRPIVALNRDLRNTNPNEAVRLGRTHIAEIDRLAESVEALNENVIDTATKFSQIIEMASVRIAGFEVNRANNTVFLTDGFFNIFLREDIDVTGMTPDGFSAVMKEIAAANEVGEGNAVGEYIFRLNTPQHPIYVKLKIVKDENYGVGLVEDVTANILEKKNIEHERDHDMLSGLLNRRAFMRELRDLFDYNAGELGVAALVMMDLDNLKHINDTYGHDYGDKYIQSAAECMIYHTPRRTISARIAGDEFYLFFYGYKSKAEIENHLRHLQRSFHNKFIYLPDQQSYPIHISGGVAWYPDDSASYEELLKFSDFAMYKVKQSRKGQVGYFDLGMYNKEVYLMQNITEFNEFLSQQLVTYFFQPIVCARTGELFAYESLMRADMQTLKSPLEILELARRQNKLDEIEMLTWYKTLEAYVAHVEAKRIPSDCKVFINSLASHIMNQEDISDFERQYKGWLNMVVMEITEEEQMNDSVLAEKMCYIKDWQAAVALDDYGSGYNSEKTLLSLSPQYVKVDMTLIRDIHEDPDRQAIVSSIINYAHERNMYIVAEGVETPSELHALIKMDVDYLQGYYIAAPDFIPPQVPPHVASEIRQYYHHYHGEA